MKARSFLKRAGSLLVQVRLSVTILDGVAHDRALGLREHRGETFEDAWRSLLS